MPTLLGPLVTILGLTFTGLDRLWLTELDSTLVPLSALPPPARVRLLPDDHKSGQWRASFTGAVVPIPGHMKRCGEYPDLSPLPGSWEAYLSGFLTLVQFCTMNPGVGVSTDPTRQTRWTTDRTECELHCPAGVWCFAGGGWVQDGPATKIIFHELELWGSPEESGPAQVFRLSINCGTRFRWIATWADGRTETGWVSSWNPCDINIDGRLDVRDFTAFLNEFAAGRGDWNQDGFANVQDFIAFLNAFAAGGC